MVVGIVCMAVDCVCGELLLVKSPGGVDGWVLPDSLAISSWILFFSASDIVM